MDITHTLESISIKTSDDKLFCELSELINKNFKKTISSKGKIISFYEEAELPQRKYFFKFLAKIFEKKSGKPLNLAFVEYKTIKLNYIQENTLAKVLSVNVYFVKDEVVFRLNQNDKAFFGYILQTFKDNSHKISQTRLNLKIKNESDFNTLKTLFSKKEHLKFIVDFHYDFDEFAKFERNFKVQNSSKFINRFVALANLLEDNFKVLNCDTTSTSDEVRESYLGLVKLYHPDRHADKSQNIQSAYRQKFEEIRRAYEGLKPFFKSQEQFISA